MILFFDFFKTVEDVIDTIEKQNHYSQTGYFIVMLMCLDKRKWTTRFYETFLKIKKKKIVPVGKELLLKNGYHEIGMDHFALETDFIHF
jgi:oxygen-independent coproporphyrinogen-3 oxidase